MKIVDTSGNELTLAECDFTAGRLLQSETEEETLVYTTWAEQPDYDESGEIIDHTPQPTVDEKIENIEDELTMTQVAITEIYEMIIPEEE